METTVSKVLISYDVSAKNPEVKAALLGLNYYDNFKLGAHAKIHHLPDTTLWHNTKSSGQAMSDMKKVCSDLKVTLEKALAVKADEFVGL
ncbi:hypothetical protein SAMN05443667_116117 [Flavobacterium gillisiae]|uniref:Uncharacterized protein n=1 Tax=Flavobacterium gillisiae TaxID=150146 RepID=A0A1H4G4K4_9FLAO|nr:hypothetical protein [Flavobacterium gillisiae]SEB04519.1 hypothetical protein SAMN05443667_116117 [Flavobacterium gillisiae]